MGSCLRRQCYCGGTPRWGLTVPRRGACVRMWPPSLLPGPYLRRGLFHGTLSVVLAVILFCQPLDRGRGLLQRIVGVKLEESHRIRPALTTVWQAGRPRTGRLTRRHNQIVAVYANLGLAFSSDAEADWLAQERAGSLMRNGIRMRP